MPGICTRADGCHACALALSGPPATLGFDAGAQRRIFLRAKLLPSRHQARFAVSCARNLGALKSSGYAYG